MSSLTISTDNRSPKGVPEEFAQFDITSTLETFRFPNMMTVGSEYTLSFWITSDCAGSIDILGETLSLKTGFDNWIRYEKPYTSSEPDLVIAFGKVGKYYIYQMQLETGNVPTAYRESDYDIKDALGRATEHLTKIITEQETDIVQTSRSIVLSALEHYVETSDYETFKTKVETELAVNADNINMTFTRTSETITEETGKINGELNKYKKYITFSENGILIGDNESKKLKLEIDNDGIRFTKAGVEIGFWDGDEFKTGNINVRTNEQARFGDFAFYPEVNGSLAFRKVGG